MLSNDTITGGETQAGPIFFGGEKRIEYLGDDGLRYAHPGIGHLNPGKLLVPIAYPEAQHSTLGHGLDSVDQEIEKDLLELAEIPQNL